MRIIETSAGDLPKLVTTPNVAIDDDVAGLVVQVGCSGAADPGLDQELVRWLEKQPVPVIACGERLHQELEPFDLVVPPADLEMLTGAIVARPRATAVLVQVLRMTGKLATRDALVVESLAYGTLQDGPEHRAWLAAQPVRKTHIATNEPVCLAREGEELRITLNSPGNRNALSKSMRDGLAEAFQLVGQDPGIRHVVVRGNGPAFSAGGDLGEFGSIGNASDAHALRMGRMPAGYLVDCADRCEFLLHGACIGAGIELPAFAQEIVADPGTRFRLPEVSMGLIPGAGGCVSIPRRIGRQRTAALAISGRELDAAEALAIGLVDEIRDGISPDG